jgi:hypothetical protein
MKTDPQHEATREAFDQAVEDLARQAKATGQTAADWTYPTPASGTSVLTPEQRAGLQATPPAKAKGKPTAKAKPPKPAAAEPQAPASPQAAAQATGRPTHYLALLNTETIWEFEVIKPRDPESPVIVRRFSGYDQQGADKRYAAMQAGKLWRELLGEQGYTWIDGTVHKLVDEDA